jgi:hypothetical protein
MRGFLATSAPGVDRVAGGVCLRHRLIALFVLLRSDVTQFLDR